MGGSIEPGWYADPEGPPGQLRWWNGDEWTQHVRPLSEFTSDQNAAESSADVQNSADSGGGTAPDQATVNLGSGSSP
ncbi:DUF2510 domain-containing protein, partial [Thermobifida cellulosilytica]|uniref:DUF2510 domain-containing protein n=1 Tax=Thermobifida cellulosilytica TaxID=144786 RepID=UPI0012EE48C5